MAIQVNSVFGLVQYHSTGLEQLSEHFCGETLSRHSMKTLLYFVENITFSSQLRNSKAIFRQNLHYDGVNLPLLSKHLPPWISTSLDIQILAFALWEGAMSVLHIGVEI